MKIISWNVAGLRACYAKGLEAFVRAEDADIYCFQETKVLPEQVPMHIEGYEEFLYPAEKKGYSGVMVYSKVSPLHVTYGIGVEEYDNEGRVITLEFADFYLVACYVPNSKRELERLSSRMAFEDIMRKHLKGLALQKHVIYCGDLNVAHEEIDIKNPKTNHMSAGFTDEERAKMTELLASGFVDTYRRLYPDEVKYTWWSYMRNAREKNIGWRLDYFIVDETFMPSVKDAGIGMSREFQKHLFETFAQERTSTTSKQLGTGLGMAIAKSYVDMMGGTISVESEVGKGTEFAVKLEFKLQGDVKPDVRLEQLKGYRALVVDDDFQSCDSIVHLLQDIGMRADFTTTAKEALFRTRMAYGDGDSYFAYIIDWIMPDMNGVELVRQIRKIIGDEVPIIILTAYYWGDIEEEAREAGVTAFCTKPLFTSDLTNIFLQHEIVSETNETFHGERILLVEDNDLNREIAKFMLEEIGFEVEIACDGQDAVRAMNHAQDGEYNYVLMDVQMPIMDGIEASKTIRRSDREYLQTVPIIALTANAFTEDVEKCLAAGMNAHLAKPFKIEDIIDILRTLKELPEQ